MRGDPVLPCPTKRRRPVREAFAAHVAKRRSRWLAVGFVLGSLSCRHVTNPVPTAVGNPTASLAPQAIIEQYQSDPKLADELFDGKLVHIDGFRVDEATDEFLWMREGGFELRLDRPRDRKKVFEGDTLGVYCEGDGVTGGNLIVFESCRSHL